MTRLPKNDRRNDPGPEELPGHSRPPLPSPAHLHLLLHRGAGGFGAGDTPGTMPLAGDDVHQAKDENLDDRLDEIF